MCGVEGMGESLLSESSGSRSGSDVGRCRTFRRGSGSLQTKSGKVKIDGLVVEDVRGAAVRFAEALGDLGFLDGGDSIVVE